MIISAITLIATVLAIVFGSVFFVSKNPNKSIEYGGGIEVLVQVKKDNKSADVELTNKVSDSLYDRLNAGGLSNVNVSSEGDGKIRVTKSGNLTDTQRKDFEEKIARKPILTV
ncbi:protein translocase subunit SecDF, partial [Mycoplasmopsis pullorum]